MSKFEMVTEYIDAVALREKCQDIVSGGFVSFEGWVRNHNEGKVVEKLEYEAYNALAESEGQKIVEEALEKFGVAHIQCQHFVGLLELGEMAVYVGVSSGHRGEAFAACRYVIDEIKHRVPIWKKEYYADGPSEWVRCERCAEGHDHSHDHGHKH
jgi:molybdopterin synthase catalytic subunit